MPEPLATALRRHLANHPRRTTTAGMALVVSAMSLYALARWAGAFVPALVDGSTPGMLWRDAAAGIGLLALATASAGLRDVTLVAIATDFSSALRLAMLRVLVRQPAAVARAQAPGEALMRVAGDITLLHQSLVRVLALWGPSVVTSAILLGALVVTTPVLALATAVLIAPMLLAIGRVSGRLTGSVRLAQEQLAALGGALGEALAGVREAKVFRREDALERRFAELSNHAVQHMLREERLAVTHPAAVSFVAVSSLLLLLMLAAWWQRRGALDAGTLTQFLVLLGLLVGPLQEAFRSHGSIVRLRTLHARCGELLASEPERDVPGALLVDEAPGSLTFAGVTVRHPSTGFVLGPVTLDVAAGETIVLVGPSGSGKSTLLELVPRLTEPDEGRLLLDGIPLERLALGSLRGRCALVPQEPYFFAGTIEENLTFAAPRVPRRALQAACRAAHVEEFVQRLPDGYATRLTRGAGNLSVGQRQRLAVARAMLVSPRILLLDEPTAALDEESEQLMVDALRAFSDGRTTLIASHAARVLPLAHRIVRLVHGRVVRVEPGARAERPHVTPRLVPGT